MSFRRLSESERQTRVIGQELAAELAAGHGVLLLTGDLGTGKTVLAQGVAAGLGIDPAEVQSPTYTLIREHEGPRARLVHVDLYRLEPDELAALGLEELLAGGGVKIVEWAERLDFPVPGALRLRLRRGSSPDHRWIETCDLPESGSAPAQGEEPAADGG